MTASTSTQNKIFIVRYPVVIYIDVYVNLVLNTADCNGSHG